MLQQIRSMCISLEMNVVLISILVEFECGILADSNAFFHVLQPYFYAICLMFCNYFLLCHFICYLSKFFRKICCTCINISWILLQNIGRIECVFFHVLWLYFHAICFVFNNHCHLQYFICFSLQIFCSQWWICAFLSTNLSYLWCLYYEVMPTFILNMLIKMKMISLFFLQDTCLEPQD